MSRILAIVFAAIGAGVGAGTGFLVFRSLKTSQATRTAVATGGTFAVHATGYWPFQAGLSDAARKMEGAPVDRKGLPLHTVEDFFSGKSDHVSVAADYTIFPYGQKVIVNWFDKTVTGRITDTGGHFHGSKKIYRVTGEEPLDFCVASSATPVPKKDVVAKIVAGDTLDKPGAAVAVNKIKDQNVVVGDEDRAALAQVIENAGGESCVEQQAVGWVMRNRARIEGVPLSKVCGGVLDSSELPASDWSVLIVSHVLSQPDDADPTNGAIDFWRPDVQHQYSVLGEMCRRSTSQDDLIGAAELGEFRRYASEDEVRGEIAAANLQVVGFAGTLELLGVA